MAVKKKMIQRLGLLVAGYLIVGLMLSFSLRPQQMYECPALEEPAGVYLTSQATPGCSPTVTVQDYMVSHVGATLFWGPYVLLRVYYGLAGTVG